jgi:hypothetical protein
MRPEKKSRGDGGMETTMKRFPNFLQKSHDSPLFLGFVFEYVSAAPQLFYVMIPSPFASSSFLYSLSSADEFSQIEFSLFNIHIPSV